MVYKVAELVKEVGVSRQMIYKYLKRDSLKACIVDLEGVMGVTEEGLHILKNIKCKEVDVNEGCKEETNNSLNDLQQELTDSLKKRIELYEDQLKMKDKQINELIQVTQNNQVLQKMILSNTEVKLLAYREELEIRRNKVQEENQKGILNKIKRFFRK